MQYEIASSRIFYGNNEFWKKEKIITECLNWTYIIFFKKRKYLSEIGIRNGGSEPETRTLSLMYIIKKLLTFLPYIGTRKEVNEPEMVTFKEYSQSKNRTLETNERDVKSETAAYKDIGSHGN